MGIKGFQGTSLLDFPGRVAALVFFGGCNLTCPFCHNPALVLTPGEFPDLLPDEVLDELLARRPFLDGVVLSGGEPTLDPGLLPLLEALRGSGVAVKIDTNGLAPSVLETVLARGLADYIALDLKTAPERYGELHPGPLDPALLAASADLVKTSGVDHEFRTTCVPGLVSEADLRALGSLAAGGRRWYLQQYAAGHALAAEWQSRPPLDREQLQQLAEVARNYVAEVAVRGL